MDARRRAGRQAGAACGPGACRRGRGGRGPEGAAGGRAKRGGVCPHGLLVLSFPCSSPDPTLLPLGWRRMWRSPVSGLGAYTGLTGRASQKTRLTSVDSDVDGTNGSTAIAGPAHGWRVYAAS
eukprot:scaffold7630_cov376-Prasinococcus_capsulatus_cf.AAC.2